MVSGEMRNVSHDIAEAVDRLVDEYRHRCLWFLRGDYYPSTDKLPTLNGGGLKVPLKRLRAVAVEDEETRSIRRP